MKVAAISTYSANNKKITFKSYKYISDIAYKIQLQQGLKKTYGISCKVEDLVSVAGPEEVKYIIDHLKPKNYKLGDNFRAQFHLHTDASDGKLTVDDYLRQCVDWSDYIAKSPKHIDNLPPFSASITDHDRMVYDKRVIAAIVQNPDKYKNFKFIAGCEFMFRDLQNKPFEAIGLGFNPFDERLEPLMKGFASNNSYRDIKIVKDAGGILSWAHPLISPEKINDEFALFLKNNGVDGVEGNYQYLQFPSKYIEEIKPLINRLIKKFGFFITGGTDTHSTSIFK